jgi:hypothetical protein
VYISILKKLINKKIISKLTKTGNTTLRIALYTFSNAKYKIELSGTHIIFELTEIM